MTFLFLDNIEKNQDKCKALNTIENIMENEAFAPKEQMFHFHNIFKNVVFQRCQRALLWSKRLHFQ